MNSEKKYISGLQNGNYASFDALFKKYSENLFSFVLSITRDSFISEEITQIVFLKVWEKRTEINEHYSFKSFLFTITYNETISYLRKIKSEKNKVEAFTSMKSYTSNETEYEIEFKNYESIAQKIIERFPEKRKQIFKMSREQGLTNKEIAKELNISIKTVENQITTSLKTLKKELNSGEVLGLFLYFMSYHQ